MRPIDADALIEQMEADAEQMDNPLAAMFAYAAVSDVKHAPTIEPERTGKWIKGIDVPNRNPYLHLAEAFYCSECLNEAYWDTDYGQQLFDYCPNCGARMES